VGIAFFVSGFSALLYQVVWQRLLGLFAGSDVRSVTIVTGAYLAGLGVGSLLGSLYADRLTSRQAVRVFALCNLGVALFGFLSRLLFYDLLFVELSALARFPAVMMVTVFVSLLWPTSLMGLSLPLLSRAVTQQVGQAAGRVGWLYGVNTLGAGIGSLTTGWYLAGTYGYEVTVHAGGLLSVIACLVALVAAGYCEAEGPAESSQTPGSVAVLPRERVPGRIWGWCLLVCASGFISISLELVWFRLLDVVLQSNAYTFGHFLSFILAAYGLGSWLRVGARVASRRRRDQRRPVSAR
jgi:hypothetical protein